MPGSPPKARRFDRASLIRHLALCAAVLVAWAWREQLRVGNSVLWIFALAALINLQVTLFSDWVRLGVVARRLSPVMGLGGWVTLMFLSGGVQSPFIAGLSLEIILSAMTALPAGIAMVTAGTVSGLWLQQAALGLEGSLLASILWSGFLLIMGGLTAYLTGRWKRTEVQLSSHQEELRRRLETLEAQLDEARTVGKLGENVARLSHGLKNAVHSLRGFVGLLEPRVASSEGNLEILTGLRIAIDHLEEIARSTLGPPESASRRLTSDRKETPRTLNEVVRDVANSFPEIRWSLSLGEALPQLKVSPEILREVLTIVVRNAAEAMHGTGEVAVEAALRGESLEIQVRDRGPGIPESNRPRLFEPGFTTKPEGHGFGLFLARRIVETHGGAVRMRPAPGGGTLCSIELPFLGQSTS